MDVYKFYRYKNWTVDELSQVGKSYRSCENKIFLSVSLTMPGHSCHNLIFSPLGKLQRQSVIDWVASFL